MHNSIIYFEDPFGKTSYKNNKQFQENIGRIIDNLKNIFKNTYIIITSREEVFREFVLRKTAIIDLEPFKKSLTINSYNDEKRQQMLLNWAAAWKCKWIENNDLKDMVVELLKWQTKLPTPLNIKDFIIATIDILDEQELLNILNAKSQETAKGFAEEIKHITPDKIKLFFSFLFISDYFTEDFVKSQYQALAKDKELDINIDNWEFDRILHQFRGNKIDTSKEYIRFSHPSYSEALQFLLLEDRIPTAEDRIPTAFNLKFFSKVLIKLTNERAAHKDIARIVASNFDKLPDKIRNILFELVSMIAENYDRLPDKIRNILFELVDNEKTARDAYRDIFSNSDKLPEDVRNQLSRRAILGTNKHYYNMYT